MSAGRGPADPSAKNIWCDAKDHARPRKYLEQNTFSKRGVQVEFGSCCGMTAEVRENPGRSRFELDVGGQTVFARHPRLGSTLVIPTCEVSPARSARHRRSQLAHDGVVGDRAPKV